MEAPYEALREQARDKRNQAIQAAQQEYRVAIRRIRSLHRLMTGESMSALAPRRDLGDETLHQLLLRILPKDRAYTVAEAYDIVCQTPVGCKYKENTIRGVMQSMVATGLLHRVGRRRGHVLWAAKDSPVPVSAYAGMTLAEAIGQLLAQHGPLRLAEIAVHLMTNGYQPDASPDTVNNAVRMALNRISGRFVKDDRGRYECPLVS